MAPPHHSDNGKFRFFMIILVAILVIFNISQQTVISDLTRRVAELEYGRGHGKSTSSSPTSVEYYLKTKSPRNMPSLRLTPEQEAKASKVRERYGGKGDMLHLGGFTKIDTMGISHNLWNFMMSYLAIKSIVDVGCGRGHSSKYFLDKGAKVLCVEGSHDAVTQSLLPPQNIVEHDFSRGPWWPEETFDAAWSVEFLEHVGRQYMDNYMPIFKKCALLFVTSSAWGGWHHVEVHEEWWWQARFQKAGFVFSPELTAKIRTTADAGLIDKFDAQHIRFRMLVFINPAVADLPQHKHVIGGDGCFSQQGVVDNRDGGTSCTDSDSLPQEYHSLLSCRKRKDVRVSETNWNSLTWNCTDNLYMRN